MKGFLRPTAAVLPDDAAIPATNIIKPPPNQFTHKLKRVQEFHFDGVRRGKPAGSFAIDTKVVLLVYNGGERCRVADGRGLYVEVEYDSLGPLRP